MFSSKPNCQLFLKQSVTKSTELQNPEVFRFLVLSYFIHLLHNPGLVFYFSGFRFLIFKTKALNYITWPSGSFFRNKIQKLSPSLHSLPTLTEFKIIHYVIWKKKKLRKNKKNPKNVPLIFSKKPELPSNTGEQGLSLLGKIKSN